MDQTLSIKKKSFEEYRAAFALKRSSIRKWAKDNKYSAAYIYDVLHYHRKGSKAEMIREKIENYLKIYN